MFVHPASADLDRDDRVHSRGARPPVDVLVTSSSPERRPVGSHSRTRSNHQRGLPLADECSRARGGEPTAGPRVSQQRCLVAGSARRAVARRRPATGASQRLQSPNCWLALSTVAEARCRPAREVATGQQMRSWRNSGLSRPPLPRPAFVSARVFRSDGVRVAASVHGSSAIPGRTCRRGAPFRAGQAHMSSPSRWCP
jgi:hypothetical protein